MELAVGIDIGGTKIKAGIADSSGKVKTRADVSTEVSKGRKQVLQNIFKAIDAVMDPDAAAIGIGVPGTVKGGKIIFCPNVTCLNGINIKKILEQRYKIKVAVENDANCFALGEAVYRAGKRSMYMIGVTLGTGVGSGIIINKEIYHGTGNAGELGHMIINFDGISRGEAEDYLSARWFNLVCGKKPKEVFELAEKRDKKSREILNNYGRTLGIFLTNIIIAFDPDCIVVGGNISNTWKYFSKAMFAEIKKRAMFNNAKIVKRKLGDDAAVLGAAYLAVKRK
jgi:glucokinase